MYGDGIESYGTWYGSIHGIEGLLSQVSKGIGKVRSIVPYGTWYRWATFNWYRRVWRASINGTVRYLVSMRYGQ
jgi:hypothetical protein